MEFIIILFLLILNGIFAMYEIALVSSSKARLETLVSKGNKSAKGVLKQLEEEKELSYADFDKYVDEICPCLDTEYDDLYHRGLDRAIEIVKQGGKS